MKQSIQNLKNKIKQSKFRKRKINQKYDSMDIASKAIDKLNEYNFNNKRNVTELKVFETIKLFETKNEMLFHKQCDVCFSRSITIRTEKHKGKNVCSSCKNLNLLDKHPKHFLPIWIDSAGITQYFQPHCLSCLREAEKLLISLVAVYIPLHHLKQGQLGFQGHVCCFQQDIQYICTELPRLPKDIKVIRVIKKFKNSDEKTNCRSFMVRKKQVLDALEWLQKHNHVYQHLKVTINPKNLNWMKNKEECELPCIIHEEILKESKNNQQHDLGPSITQKCPENEKTDRIEVSGFTSNQKSIDPTTEEQLILSNKLKQACQKSTKHINWPFVSEKAISEYNENTPILLMAFPWLFPGGYGAFDIASDKNNVKFANWIKKIMFYFDGRFAKDKMFCFYILNLYQRRRTQSQGSFFVNGFAHEKSRTLHEILEEIKKGNSSWISKIIYFSANIIGSPAYWRSRRHEVYTWISHHISEQHGPPNFFITLSCAEYQWNDIKNLSKIDFRIL